MEHGNTQAELIIVARHDGQRHAIAARGGRITASARTDADVEELLRDAHADAVVRQVDGVLTPLFVDTHNHLTLTARNELGVPMRDARTVAEIVDAIRSRAAGTPAGSWIVTAADWHESRVQEGRLPTALELDAATDQHPVLVLRGGHNGVLNSLGLRLAGITATSGDVDGGHVDRAPDGTPLGAVQDEALTTALRLLPPAPTEALVAGIEAVSREYRRHGIGVVRDAAVSPEEWRTMQRAHEQHRLHVRTYGMILSPAALIAAAGSMDAYLEGLEAAGLRAGEGDDMLRLWGIKLILDGGVEAAALREPYAGSADYRGTVMLSAQELADALAACVRRGWPVGTHAFGDAAIDVFLDAVEHNVDSGIEHRPGEVVLEHGGLIVPQQIARAVALGVHITSQQALLAGLVGPLTTAWGAERTARLFPWRSLVDLGASVSAGTDHPIGPLDPIEGIVGMSTRRTAAGVTGAEHAIDRASAIELYTRAGAGLLGHGLTGTLAIGAPADLAVYPVDIRTAPTETLTGILPTLTALGGSLLP